MRITTFLNHENPMNQVTLLQDKLRPHLAWHGARLSFVATFLIALFRVKTVNFSELATVSSGKAQIDSHIQATARHKNVKARVKEAIKSEFNHRCAYCGSKSKRLTLDHVLAESKGGINSWSNLVPACAKCNYLYLIY